MAEEILVIGGVAAGLSAASRVRRLNPKARITVLERGPAAGYGACGLPYVLSGRLPGLAPLRAHPEAFFREQRRIEVLTGHEALEIEPGRRRVRVRQDGGAFWLAYDHLILATGATARWQPEPAGLRNVFRANTWVEVEALEAGLRSGEIRKPAVVGGGYIGLEVAEGLRRRGFEVRLIHAHAQGLSAFDAELAEEVTARLEAEGIRMHLGVRVLGLEGAAADPKQGRVRALATSQGVIEADAVINCAGLRPEVELAQAAGVALGRTGAIAVDERQQTSQPGIYAAGDCAETRHLVTGAATWIPLGGAANRQGRVAGQNAAGGPPARFPGVLGSLAVPLGGLEWGRTGLSLEQARAAGLAAQARSVTAGDRAGYLEPAKVTLKIVYEPGRGRLLGCHVRGAPGTVAPRLHAAAVALTAGMTLEQIEQLDLAYAPELTPLYDPLLIAAHNARR